ncbi:hypothetical protein OKW30_004474 [Paraburkholderia sp. Clong3]|uniref:hypothetical protein n=1 Tax=Paraburkholderia sp. Clong3 TaxID=2991061 RepID=UPI003D258612
MSGITPVAITALWPKGFTYPQFRVAFIRQGEPPQEATGKAEMLALSIADQPFECALYGAGERQKLAELCPTKDGHKKALQRRAYISPTVSKVYCAAPCPFSKLYCHGTGNLKRSFSLRSPS